MTAPAFSVASLRSTCNFRVRVRLRVRMVNKKSGPKAPVVLASGLSLRRQRRRERGETLDVQALTAPVPGTLLVLLSRLHRREEAVPGLEAFPGAPDPLSGGPTALSSRDPDL